MIQTPPPIPEIPFDWNLFVNNTLAPIVVTVIVGIGFIIALKIIMRSPVGDAWAERVRRKTSLKYGDPGLSGEQAAVQLDGVQDQLGRIESHLAEMNERLDFTERVLIKKDPGALGAGR